MNVKLMSLGLEITPKIEQANNKIESFMTKYYSSDEKFTQYNNEKVFVTALSKAVKNDDVVVLATETQLFGPFKSFIAKAFNLNKKRNKKIITTLKSTYPDIKNDVKEYKSQSTIPVGSVSLVSEDGKYSGFVIKSGKKIVLVLPLDEHRLENILDVEFVKYLEEHFPKVIENSKNINEEPPYDEKLIQDTVGLMNERKNSFAIAATKTVDFINIINDKVVDLSEVAVQTDYTETKGDRPPKEYVVSLARGAKEKLKSPLGAALTNVFTVDKENGEPDMFLYVCVADDNEANALKIFAKKGETLPHFVLSAVNEMFLMISSWERTGSVFLPVEEKIINKNEHQLEFEDGKDTFKTKAIVSVLLILSIIVSIIVVTVLDDVYNLRGTLAQKSSISVCNFNENNLIVKVNAKQLDKHDNTTGHGGLEFDSALIDNLNKENNNEDNTKAENQATENTKETTKINTNKSETTQSKTQKPSTTEKSTTTQKTTTKKKGPYPETLVLAGKNVETAEAVARIVQAEMGFTFHDQALKAQAVAVFTYIKHNNWRTSGLSCKTYSSTKVKNAVNSVLGQAVLYHGRPALTTFHAISAGKTVPSNTVWNINHSISYLSGGVVSPEGSSVRNYKTIRTYSSSEMKSKIESALNITLGDDPSKWIKINSHSGCVNSNTGYVTSMTVGSKTISGHVFRTSVMSYGIRSHCFNVTYNASSDKFTFNVYGYGHGIGLSQRGANYYARKGWSYKQILNHYYPGTVTR